MPSFSPLASLLVCIPLLAGLGCAADPQAPLIQGEASDKAPACSSCDDEYRYCATDVRAAHSTFDDAWFDLPNERFLKARGLKGTGEDSEDAVLLISCDVDEPRLRIVVISGKKSVKRLSIEGVPQDLPVLKAASIFMLRAAYIGFNK